MLDDLVDSLALDSAPVPTVVDDMYFGTSPDAVAQGAEATVPAVAGVGTVAAWVGSRYLLIFRLVSEGDIVRVTFSDDVSNTNQVGAFAKQGPTVVPTGEVLAFNVWVSNQSLTQAADVTITVS